MKHKALMPSGEITDKQLSSLMKEVMVDVRKRVVLTKKKMDKQIIQEIAKAQIKLNSKR